MSSYEEAAVLMPGYHCCRFRGSVSSLDAATGKLLWRAYTIDKEATVQRKNAAGADVLGPAGAAVWSAPTVDAAHHTVYITTGDNYSDPPTATSDAVLAFDTETGKLLWSKQVTESDIYNMACGKPGVGSCPQGSGPDFDFGAPPILVKLPSGKRALLLGQKSGMVSAVDPDANGKLLWQARAGKGSPLGGIEWGMASNGNLLFAAVSDIGFAHSPVPGKLNPDPKVGGGLSAFSVSSGKLVWKAAPVLACGGRNNCSPAQSAAITAIDGAVFSGALDGHIRAYSSKDGAVLWDFDTVRAFQTVNGVPGNGGSMDVAGPVIADGMVFVNSGYPQFGGTQGNVFLAFGTE
jgi:polyvinyl alcohol dehydrogenase (cytochrome)